MSEPGAPGLPLPPPGLHDVGDGDFAAIGREFADHLIRRAGLTPEARVLDIGCGVGRLARALAGHLSPAGRYTGFDVSAPAIAWCAAELAGRLPNFSFVCLDIVHPLYNPGGAVDPRRVVFPAAAAGIDVAAAVSVFTHLPPDVVGWYLREVRRVLAPGGRFLCTAFLLDDRSRAALRAGRCRIPFRADEAGDWQDGHPDHPGAAVAIDRAWFLTAAAAAGLEPAGPLVDGSWPGDAPGESFQDLCVLRRMSDGATP
jgi:SAM-dependent methyltransferase